MDVVTEKSNNVALRAAMILRLKFVVKIPQSIARTGMSAWQAVVVRLARNDAAPTTAIIPRPKCAAHPSPCIATKGMIVWKGDAVPPGCNPADKINAMILRCQLVVQVARSLGLVRSLTHAVSRLRDATMQTQKYAAQVARVKSRTRVARMNAAERLQHAAPMASALLPLQRRR
jgi:hypothetical protein